MMLLGFGSGLGDDWWANYCSDPDTWNSNNVCQSKYPDPTAVWYPGSSDTGSDPSTQTTVSVEAPPPIPPSQPGFVNVGGVCRATDSATLDQFKNLQRQLNRVADVKGYTKIGPDGVIGNLTLTLLNQVLNQGLGCSDVANQIDALTTAATTMADSLGASSSVSSPAPAKRPAIVNMSTGKVTPQPVTTSLSDTFKNLSTFQKIVGGIVLGVGGIFAAKYAKKRWT